MAIDLYIVAEEDFNKPIGELGSIEYDDLIKIHHAAEKLGLYSVRIIDPWGDTIINRPFKNMLLEELKQLRVTPGLSEEALDLLEKAVKTELGDYVRCIGD